MKKFLIVTLLTSSMAFAYYDQIQPGDCKKMALQELQKKLENCEKELRAVLDEVLVLDQKLYELDLRLKQAHNDR